VDALCFYNIFNAMKCIVLKSFGGTDQLVYEDVPTPALKPGEVLIENRAISINPVDVKTRKGKGQAARLARENPMILGWDVSGVVKEAYVDSSFAAGDEVFGMINIPGHGKCYAQFVAAPVSHITRKPGNISHAAAAASCLAAMTAWQALVKQAAITSGQRILIQAASGGVGHFAVQMAKYFGCYVIGSSSASNREFVLSIGADEHIDYNAGDPVEQIDKVDVVIDGIGGENIPRSLAVLKEGGTIISLPSGVSETVGEQAERQGKKGIFFFVQSSASDMEQIAKLLAEGIVVPHISRTFSFNDIRAAHEHIESGRTVGKVIVDFSLVE
jgi:NADPH:quinone reductase-like Zn-dependent oxidoreductase